MGYTLDNTVPDVPVTEYAPSVNPFAGVFKVDRDTVLPLAEFKVAVAVLLVPELGLPVTRYTNKAQLVTLPDKLIVKEVVVPVGRLLKPTATIAAVEVENVDCSNVGVNPPTVIELIERAEIVPVPKCKTKNTSRVTAAAPMFTLVNV